MNNQKNTNHQNNKTIMQYFEWYLPAEGLFWKRCAAQAKELSEMGITSIWLPPAYKGAGGASDVGYGVYDLYDLGEFDQKGTTATKYGTKSEYIAAIEALHKESISVIADIVLNHKMGADEKEAVSAVATNQENRNQEAGPEQKIEAWTRFTFPGRHQKYSDFIWEKRHFKAADWDDKKDESAVFLFKGKEWDEDVDKEKGNFDYLMGVDIDLDNPEVKEELRKWGLWYINLTHIDGLRLDAVKHISAGFYKEWLEQMRGETHRALPAMGEYWSSDINALKYYLEECGEAMHLFDVPLHFRFFEAANAGGAYDMGSLMQNTLVTQRPELAITFVDNHDSQPGQALQSFVQAWFKPLAYGVILLREEGVPCIFYGDYYGIPYNNIAPVKELPLLLKLRHSYAYGEQHDYFDHKNIIGWTREGDQGHPNSGMAVLMSNGEGGVKTMYVGKHFAGRTFRDCTVRNLNHIIIDENGNGEFAAPGGGIALWVPEEAYSEIVIEEYK